MHIHIYIDDINIFNLLIFYFRYTCSEELEVANVRLIKDWCGAGGLTNNLQVITAQK